MASSWDTPPNGDFASYVERLTAEAARRNLMAQRAGQHALQSHDGSFGGEQDAASAPQGTAAEQAAAEQRARALFAPPGMQFPTEHPLTRGLRQLMKKLESNLQDIAQQQQKQKAK